MDEAHLQSGHNSVLFNCLTQYRCDTELQKVSDDEMDLDDDESSSDEQTRKWGGSVSGRANVHRDFEGA